MRRPPFLGLRGREADEASDESSFWVCEKSDGVRVLVLIVASKEGQEVFLVSLSRLSRGLVGRNKRS